MGITRRDGFQIFGEGSSIESLAIESDRISDYMNYFIEKHFKKLYISSFHGFRLSNLSFLNDYPFIDELYIFSDDIDYSAIHALQGLKFLILSIDKKGELDFQYFPRIEFITFSWHHTITNFETCRNLKEVHIRDYKSKSYDLRELPELNSLLYLELVESTIKSLGGLERFANLSKLELHYLTKLESIDGVQVKAATLTELLISKSKKIKDHYLVANLKKLKTLAFNDCGEIESIDFIRNLPELTDFRFVNTNVLDGDLSPCLTLDNAGFLSKKHYSHTPKQMKELLKKN